MEEVNSDHKVVNRPLPPNLREKIDQKIMSLDLDKGTENGEAETAATEKMGAKAEEMASEKERFSAEERELMRLGKVYRKKRKLRKYYVLVAAVICALAFGITSMGGPERIFEKFNWTLAGREQTNIDSDEDVEQISEVKEEEAYDAIESKFGFYPVKPNYKSEGIELLEMKIGEEIQGINLIYGKDDKVSFTYFIRPDYRTSSFGTDIEDDVVNKYNIQNDDVSITVKQYSVDGVDSNRWSGEFCYQDVHYFIVANDMKQEEFEKILKNLYFF